MNAKKHIASLLVFSTALSFVAAQQGGLPAEASGLTKSEWFYMDRARKDAAYEHQLHFGSQADEVDFWDDQRRFEQKLSQENLKHYQAYRQGKKKAYLEHTEVCTFADGHGDYYLRQASMYLQYDDGDRHPYMTMSEVKRGRGWEVSYLPGQNNPN